MKRKRWRIADAATVSQKVFWAAIPLMGDDINGGEIVPREIGRTQNKQP